MNYLFAWLPVAVWLVIIGLESTERMGAAQTAGILSALLQWLHIHMEWDRVAELNHVLRKTGHFFGYGTLGLLFVRGWLLTLRERISADEALRRAVLLGFFCTMAVACADELHQRFLPGRTASPYDVALDCFGAAVLTVFWIPGLRRMAEA